MADSWSQRLIASASNLPLQALTDRSNLAKDLCHLTLATKNIVHPRHQSDLCSNGEPSTTRSRRPLYKHELESLKSVSTKVPEQIVKLDTDQQESDQCVFDATAAFEHSILELDTPTAAQDRPWSCTEVRPADASNDWNFEHTFTYTWSKGDPQGDAYTGRPKGDIERECSDVARPRAATRVDMVSAHLVRTSTRDLSGQWKAQSIYEGCPHVRRFTQVYGGSQKHLSMADKTSTMAPASINRWATVADRPIPATVNSSGARSVNETDGTMAASSFDCPFPHCQHTLASGAYWIMTWDDTDDLSTLHLSQSKGRDLMCVHDGCLDYFVGNKEWRDHILTPHHENLGESLTERMKRVWAKRAAMQ